MNWAQFFQQEFFFLCEEIIALKCLCPVKSRIQFIIYLRNSHMKYSKFAAKGPVEVWSTREHT